MDDLSDIAALFCAYAAALPVDLAYQGFDAELAGLPGAYVPPHGALMIARDGAGVPLGCVAMRPLGEGVCEMKRLHVAPAARGQGLGRRMVEAIVAAARAAGHGEMRLDTLPMMDAAIGLYRAAGFVPIAPYYPTPVAGTLFLGLPLVPAAGR